MTNRIKQLREAFNMTQEELGEKIGVKKAAVAKYESGTVENIKQNTLMKMAKVFGVSPAFIMAWSDNPQEPSLKELQLLRMFGKLNNMGQNEALKRVGELSCISVYTNDIIDNVTMIAAHDNGATPEEMEQDIIRAIEIIAKKGQG